jgi:hypothetical protein
MPDQDRLVPGEELGGDRRVGGRELGDVACGELPGEPGSFRLGHVAEVAAQPELAACFDQRATVGDHHLVDRPGQRLHGFHHDEGV